MSSLSAHTPRVEHQAKTFPVERVLAILTEHKTIEPKKKANWRACECFCLRNTQKHPIKYPKQNGVSCRSRYCVQTLTPINQNQDWNRKLNRPARLLKAIDKDNTTVYNLQQGNWKKTLTANLNLSRTQDPKVNAPDQKLVLPKQFDNVTKRGIRRDPKGFVTKLLGIEADEFEVIETEQLSMKTHLADSFIRITTGNEQAIVHCEFQTHDSRDAPMPFRIAGYKWMGKLFWK